MALLLWAGGFFSGYKTHTVNVGNGPGASKWLLAILNLQKVHIFLSWLWVDNYSVGLVKSVLREMRTFTWLGQTFLGLGDSCFPGVDRLRRNLKLLVIWLLSKIGIKIW